MGGAGLSNARSPTRAPCLPLRSGVAKFLSAICYPHVVRYYNVEKKWEAWQLAKVTACATGTRLAERKCRQRGMGKLLMLVTLLGSRNIMRMRRILLKLTQLVAFDYTQQVSNWNSTGTFFRGSFLHPPRTHCRDTKLERRDLNYYGARRDVAAIALSSTAKPDKHMVKIQCNSHLFLKKEI